MKILELQYKKNGYDHRQIFRQDDIAIYETTTPESGRVIGYEVFIIQKNKSRVIAGQQIAASESTPSNEQWGKSGWTHWLKSAAMEKATVLLKNRNMRNLSNGRPLQTVFS
ncbi:MAG TPA: hypothetical protein PKA77_17115 [Chitinophagaceae bacterium]|jgi:hypothetical protein|nr:hypothetical protein [Chitinophagaceae bacterium]